MIRFIITILFAVLTVSQIANAQATEAPKAAEAAPMSVGLLVDNSGSYRLLLDRVITLAAEIIDQKGADDEMFLMTFVDTSKIVVRQEFTTAKSGLQDAAENMFVEGGRTAIMDALKSAAKEFENAQPDRQRILILVSDGDDRDSFVRIEDAIKLLKEQKIRVFAIGLSDEQQLNAKILDRITRETGGEKFIPKTRADTAAVVKQIWPAIRKN